MLAGHWGDAFEYLGGGGFTSTLQPEADLRRSIRAETSKIEFFNGFLGWIKEKYALPPTVLLNLLSQLITHTSTRKRSVSAGTDDELTLHACSRS